MYDASVGTFNLNNLFSRFNYEAEVAELPAEEAVITSSTTFPVGDPTAQRFRTYRGRLVMGKPAEERAMVAGRVLAMDADVLAVQEVEDIDTLKRFNADDLAGRYRWVALIEGNDPRLIDLGLLSKLPLGAVSSWRHIIHPAVPSDPVFSRDLLQVEVLNKSRSRVLMTVFNNHLKSHFVPFESGAARALRAVRPHLARPRARRKTDGRVHRPTHTTQRRRQRPRPRLDNPQPLARHKDSGPPIRRTDRRNTPGGRADWRGVACCE